MRSCIPLGFISLNADKISIMISCVDHPLYSGEQADAESPPALITAVLWTAQDIQLSQSPNIVLARLLFKEFTEPAPLILE